MHVLPFGLLVKIHDDHLKHEQTLVDELALLHRFGIYLVPGLVDALRSRQIHQM